MKKDLEKNYRYIYFFLLSLSLIHENEEINVLKKN